MSRQVALRDVRNCRGSEAPPHLPSAPKQIWSRIFFAATDLMHGRELWHVVEIVQLETKPDDEPNSVNLKSSGKSMLPPTFAQSTERTREVKTGHGQGLERRIEAGLPARGVHKNAVDLAFLEGLDEEETDTEDLGDLAIADLLVPV